jgi:hypothetical protein
MKNDKKFKNLKLIKCHLYNIIRKLDLQLPVQSVLITTKVASSNPDHGEEYSI